MKATDLRPKTEDQLKEELGNLRKEAFNLRFQKAGGQLGKTAREAFALAAAKLPIKTRFITRVGEGESQ